MTTPKTGASRSSRTASSGTADADQIAQLEADRARLEAEVAQLREQQTTVASVASARARSNGNGTRQQPVDDDPDILGLPGVKPLRISTDTPLSTEREPMFYIGDEAYTVPVEVPVSVATEFLHLAVNGPAGELQAQDYLLTALLGDEQYKKLRSSQHVTASHFRWIVQTLTRKAIGAVENPKE